MYLKLQCKYCIAMHELTFWSPVSWLGPPDSDITMEKECIQRKFRVRSCRPPTSSLFDSQMNVYACYRPERSYREERHTASAYATVLNMIYTGRESTIAGHRHSDICQFSPVPEHFGTRMGPVVLVQIGSRCSGTRLGLVSRVLDLLSHWHFFNQHRTDRRPGSLAFRHLKYCRKVHVGGYVRVQHSSQVQRS